MERELWTILSAAISDVKRGVRRDPRSSFGIDVIVRLHLWAVLHDRPASWACRPRSWCRRTRPAALPSQPTLSRRMRSGEFASFMHKLSRRLAGNRSRSSGRSSGRSSASSGRSNASSGGSEVSEGGLVRIIDGKPMMVSRHTQDRQATWGRGAGQMGCGYKLHAVWGGGDMPDAFEVTGLGDDEKHVARRLLRDLPGGGYVLGDAFFDSNPLHGIAGAKQMQLVAPRKSSHRGRGLGQRRHTPGRLRSIAITEPPPGHEGFGAGLMKWRREIETYFGNLVSFGGGLSNLPAWVRTLPRVRRWIHAKLLINAARRRRKRATRA